MVWHQQTSRHCFASSCWGVPRQSTHSRSALLPYGPTTKSYLNFHSPNRPSIMQFCQKASSLKNCDQTSLLSSGANTQLSYPGCALETIVSSMKRKWLPASTGVALLQTAPTLQPFLQPCQELRMAGNGTCRAVQQQIHGPCSCPFVGWSPSLHSAAVNRKPALNSTTYTCTLSNLPYFFLRQMQLSTSVQRIFLSDKKWVRAAPYWK